MVNNFKLVIEYDGTNYHGWQRQPNGPTIQEEIETALQKMTRQSITLLGSGRTDAGVHALAQVASFICDTRMEPGELQKGLNSLLPSDIVIRECSLEKPDFHARYDAKSKTYRYCIFNHPIPPAIGRQYAWWIRSSLDIMAMDKALAHIRGIHDFKAFEGAGSPRAHTVRRIMRAEIKDDPPGRIRVEIEADGFLRYMVRNIVGTLVAVGRGKISADRFNTILASRDRGQAGATAPPQGLFLVCVRYP